jgi:hypothetical protein
MEVTTTTSRARRSVASPKPEQRSRITNGSALLAGIDGRSAAARRYKDIVRAILADQGGAEQCSETKLHMIRRFAAITVAAEGIESRLANGEPINVDEHARLATMLMRLAQKIGIGRVSDEVTPSLHEYLAGRQERRR